MASLLAFACIVCFLTASLTIPFPIKVLWFRAQWNEDFVDSVYLTEHRPGSFSMPTAALISVNGASHLPRIPPSPGGVLDFFQTFNEKCFI